MESGTVVPLASGGVASVRLRVQNGDGALQVGIDPADAVPVDQLTALTESLAAQVRYW